MSSYTSNNSNSNNSNSNTNSNTSQSVRRYLPNNRDSDLSPSGSRYYRRYRYNNRDSDFSPSGSRYNRRYRYNNRDSDVSPNGSRYNRPYHSRYNRRYHRNHPSYQGMVLEALYELNDYSTSRQIRNYIRQNYSINDNDQVMRFYVNRAINRLVDRGYIVRNSTNGDRYILTESGRHKYLREYSALSSYFNSNN